MAVELERLKEKAIKAHLESCIYFVPKGYKTLHGFLNDENRCWRYKNNWESLLPKQDLCSMDCDYMNNFIEKLSE